jgi:hypothetical protein
MNPIQTARSFDDELSTLSVASADSPDPERNDIQQVLALVRDHMGMDVVFVSEFVAGLRVVRLHCAGDVPAPLRSALARRGGFSTPLEHTLCQRMMDGRLPNLICDLPALRATQDLPDPGLPIGSYLAVPVTREDGSLYGALCCLTLKPNSALGELELKRLRMAARLVSRLLQQ